VHALKERLLCHVSKWLKINNPRRILLLQVFNKPGHCQKAFVPKLTDGQTDVISVEGVLVYFVKNTVWLNIYLLIIIFISLTAHF
jgi:hypothetical protein